MVDILHKVGVKAASVGPIYDALTTIDGLTRWWTADTRGKSDVGGVIHFQFEAGFFDMKVLESEPGKRVLWQVVDGPSEWVGTKVSWNLEREGSYVMVRFKHEGWREPTDFMHHCSTKWASFLFSLKAFLETGRGAPHPNDVRIIDDLQ